MADMMIHEHRDRHSLTFYCGELAADEAIVAADHEPNGYFWEGVAQYVAPDLVEHLELDSEGDMFCAIGDRPILERLQPVLEPYLTDADKMTAMIQEAEAAGFEFAD